MDTGGVGTAAGRTEVWLEMEDMQGCGGTWGKWGGISAPGPGENVFPNMTRDKQGPWEPGWRLCPVLWLPSEQHRQWRTSACLSSSKCELGSNKINSLGKAKPQAHTLAADLSLIAGGTVGRGVLFFFFGLVSDEKAGLEDQS